LGYILGDFFINPSGHPGAGPCATLIERYRLLIFIEPKELISNGKARAAALSEPLRNKRLPNRRQAINYPREKGTLK
jgi:hypothetical protein